MSCGSNGKTRLVTKSQPQPQRQSEGAAESAQHTAPLAALFGHSMHAYLRDVMHLHVRSFLHQRLANMTNEPTNC